MKKIIPTVITSMLVITNITPIAQAEEQENNPPLTVSQGDIFHTKRGEKIGDPEGEESEVITISCTVGYIDKKKRRAYTAGHCGITGTKVTDSEDRLIGIFHKNPKYNEKVYRNDQAYIQLENNVIPGKNYYSGDKVASLDELNTGDTLCSYGSSSQKIHCGVLRTVDERNIIGDDNSGGISGDSGGPAWVPGKGLVGLFSSTYYTGKEENNSKKNYAHVFNSIYGTSKSHEGSDVKPMKRYDNGKYSYDLKQIIDTSSIYIRNGQYNSFVKDIRKQTNQLFVKLASKLTK